MTSECLPDPQPHRWKSQVVVPYRTNIYPPPLKKGIKSPGPLFLVLPFPPSPAPQRLLLAVRLRLTLSAPLLLASLLWLPHNVASLGCYLKF